jgi:hypothetical protein
MHFGVVTGIFPGQEAFLLELTPTSRRNAVDRGLEPAVDQAGQPLGVTGNQLRRQHQQQRIRSGECIVGRSS